MRNLGLLLDAGLVRRAPSDNLYDLLTAREMEVFKLVALDNSVKAISGALFISDKTTAYHIKRIKDKLNCPSMVGMCRLAIAHKIIPTPCP